MRNLDEKPYSPDEERVAEFFFERGTGGGDDPISCLLVGYQYLVAERNRFREALEEISKGRWSVRDEIWIKTPEANIARAALYGRD